MMNSRLKPARKISGVLGGLALLLLSLAGQAEEVKEWLPYLPASANVVAVVRVDELLASPRSKSEGWAAQQSDRFLAGVSSIPPGVDTLILGVQFRPHAGEMVSSVGIATMDQGVSLQSISDRENGAPLDQIGGRPAVQSSHNAYYVALSENILAIVSPLSRQEASRYVRLVTSDSPQVPPANYLVKAASAKHHIVIAMDLEEMANPSLLTQELAGLPGVSGNPLVLNDLSELVRVVRGVRLTADVTDKTQAALSIDFGRSPGESALRLRPLVLRIISDAGLHISELDDAKVTIEEESLVFRIEDLSDSSLRTVFSLVNPAAPVPETTAAVPAPMTNPPPPASTAASPDSLASKRYLRTVNQCLDDLEKANRKLQQPSQNATWHENIARKIEKLSTRGVAPELVSYGKSISQKLQGLAASLRGVAIEVDITQGTLVWNASYDPGATYASIWGGYGYQSPTYRWDSNLQQVREKQAEAVIRGEKDRLKAWEVIHAERDQATEWTEKTFGRISP